MAFAEFRQHEKDKMFIFQGQLSQNLSELLFLSLMGWREVFIKHATLQCRTAISNVIAVPAASGHSLTKDPSIPLQR